MDRGFVCIKVDSELNCAIGCIVVSVCEKRNRSEMRKLFFALVVLSVTSMWDSLPQALC